MNRLLGPRLSPIGLCLDSRFVTAAQLRRTSQGWALAAAARLPRASGQADPDTAEVRWVRAALSRQGFRGRRAVLAAPEGRLHSAILEMPPRSSGAPLDDLAAAELARMHGYDPSQAETVCWDVPASPRFKDGTQVMALACPHAAAEGLLDVFESAGLEVAVLDTRLHALRRACRPMLSGTGLAAVLDLARDSVLLSLFYRDDVIYERILNEAGVAQLAQAIGQEQDLEADSVDYILDQVGLSPREPEVASDPGSFGAAMSLIRAHVESVLGELKAPFSYAARQYPGAAVDAVLLAGCGASIPGLPEHARSRLNVKVCPVAPRDVVACPPALADKGGDPSWTVAVGLAQHPD